MPRKKRSNSGRTVLAQFILRLRDREGSTFRQLAEVAQCSPSIVHSWSTGSLPCESITALKRLCEHYGVPLAVSLTGSPEKGQGATPLDFLYNEKEVFNGLARIKITKLVERAKEAV
jgi:transcriptional regulator with XRE-family HTH domain